MSWSVYITDNTGARIDCGKCTHVAGCQIVKIAPSIAAVLTSVDNCCDGQMATGTARLECNAFNPQPEEPADGEAAAESTDESASASVEGPGHVA